MAYSGEEAQKDTAPPPGRRLLIPLNICVLQGLSFVKARLLSMEIPAHIGETHTKLTQMDIDGSEKASGPERQADRLMKLDPYRGSWGVRFLELELSNPTDVVFELCVSVDMENSNNSDKESLSYCTCEEFGDRKTRIDRDYTARVLIPLEHFKLPVLDDSFLIEGSLMNGANRSSGLSEKNINAELSASIKNLISRINVRWQSGRNSSGELDIKDAIQAALQASIMDVLLPDPLTFGFGLAESSSYDPTKAGVDSFASGGSVLAHNMTAMEVLVRNNTKEIIRIKFSISCKDVAGENCTDGSKATVLWEGGIYWFIIIQLGSVSVHVF